MNDDILRLRDEIAALDRALLELIERRFQLAAEVGRIKAETGRPVVVKEVERSVLLRARSAAETCGVSPEVMESIFSAIIHGSIERQHRVGVELGKRGGARVLVAGAAGDMGGWLRRFLASIGHAAEGADPAWKGLDPEPGRWASLDEVPGIDSFDALFVAVPLEATAGVLRALAARKVKPPVVEIASIKSHLAEPLARLRQGGTPVLSLHPMFGPSQSPYQPLTVVHAVHGDEEEERKRVLDLLAHPYLDLVSLPFERHDPLMGWLLGLAHFTGMLFAGALGKSGLDPRVLERTASTTFKRQVSTAHSVLAEDPRLYFDIQHLNPMRGEVYAALRRALDELAGAVERGDRDGFAALLDAAGGALPPGPGVGQ